MRPETQIKIARTTAFVLIFILLISPPISLYDKIMTEDQEISLHAALLFMGLMYLIMIPLILLCSIFAWVLKHRKFKMAVVLLLIHILWAIGSAIVGGPGMLILEIIVIVLLLQGVLGIRKLEKPVCEI